MNTTLIVAVIVIGLAVLIPFAVCAVIMVRAGKLENMDKAIDEMRKAKKWMIASLVSQLLLYVFLCLYTIV